MPDNRERKRSKGGLLSNLKNINASRAARAPKEAGPEENTPATRQKQKTPKQKKIIRMSNRGWMLYIVAIIAISCILSFFAITMSNDMFGFVKTDNVVAVAIDKEDNLNDIANKLKENDIIAYKGLFKFYVKISGNENKFNYGNYDLNQNMTYQQIVSSLKKVSKDAQVVSVTIPEGYEMDQIFTLLEEKGVCTKERLEDTAENYPYKHEFLKNVPDRENRLEGYLFPDTYDFYTGDDPVQVLNKMLNNFANKYDDACAEQAEKLGMSMDEVIILASMIEKEAANDEERADISAVFHNRLNNPSEFPYLQSDATAMYGKRGDERTATLTTEQKNEDSPYNTYKVKGLPVGPICSPGMNSIEAALNPSNKDYYYFVAMKDGSESLFAKTYEQHQRNIEKAGY